MDGKEYVVARTGEGFQVGLVVSLTIESAFGIPFVRSTAGVV